MICAAGRAGRYGILTQPEDNSTRVRFDTIYNFIVTVTSGDQIDQFLIICARNGYGSVE